MPLVDNQVTIPIQAEWNQNEIVIALRSEKDCDFQVRFAILNGDLTMTVDRASDRKENLPAQVIELWKKVSTLFPPNEGDVFDPHFSLMLERMTTRVIELCQHNSKATVEDVLKQLFEEPEFAKYSSHPQVKRDMVFHIEYMLGITRMDGSIETNMNGDIIQGGREVHGDGIK